MFITMAQHVTDSLNVSFFSLDVWLGLLDTVISLPFLFFLIIHGVLERGHLF